MKDSGIEIIGKTPEHWNIRRLATLGFFSKGKNVTKSDLVENGEPVILYSHIYTTYSRVTNLPKFFISREKSLETTKVSKGMFLLTSSGESAEDIGKTLLYNGEKEISVGGDMVIFSLKTDQNFDYEFLSYSFNSDYCQHQKSSMSRGDIVVHIYEKQLREIWVAVPPKSEQIQISNYLNDCTQQIDQLLKKNLKKIKILKEYRESLISSVVTGKLRVTEDMI